MMEFRYLGRTGLRVSELCLGAMTFGRETSIDDSHRMMDMFADAGGNFIDTANVYGRGTSEEIVGDWLGTRRREDYIVATKVRFQMGEGVNAAGLSRKHILDAVEASLSRLKTDYIDLYQVHMWDPRTPLDETLSALDMLVKSGMVRYIGASNYAGWQLQKAIDLSRQAGFEAFVSLQPLYNLLDRSVEWELIPVALNEGLGVIPWSPLRGGWLSGKYTRGMVAPPEDTRVAIASEKGWSESWEAYATERTWAILDELNAIAAETDKAVPQVALRWLLQRPAVTAPIIGASKIHHLESNLGATGWFLSPDQMARLNQVSAVRPPYPWDFLGDLQSAGR